jgi:hypothetical protein
MASRMAGITMIKKQTQYPAIIAVVKLNSQVIQRVRFYHGRTTVSRVSMSIKVGSWVTVTEGIRVSTAVIIIPSTAAIKFKTNC